MRSGERVRRHLRGRGGELDLRRRYQREWRAADRLQNQGGCGGRRLLVRHLSFEVFLFNDPATTEIYTLSLHDALPICTVRPTSRDLGSISPVKAMRQPSTVEKPFSSLSALATVADAASGSSIGTLSVPFKSSMLVAPASKRRLLGKGRIWFSGSKAIRTVERIFVPMS